ncbi:MAG: hypothetical protein HYV09_37870 [Deltaproteobacteria bacterium]|nr:hypothetical protein [Deltaproteobacteria bacterium]
MKPLHVVLAVALGVVACGSKVDPGSEPAVADSGATDVSPGDTATEVASDAAVLPTEERTCKRLVDAMCGAASEACCRTLGIAWAAGGCREAATAYCSTRIDAVTLGRATYDDSKLEDCARSWTSMITTCQQEFVPYVKASAICAQLFNGTKEPGAACASSVECNAPVGSVAYCDQTAKRCRTSTVVPEGAQCNFTGSRLRYCEDGFYCDLTGATSACRKELAPGAACSSSNYIACGYSSTCVDDKCATGLGGGEPCTESRECSSWTCAAGTCNSVLYPMVDKSLCNGGTS